MIEFVSPLGWWSEYVFKIVVSDANDERAKLPVERFVVSLGLGMKDFGVKGIQAALFPSLYLMGKIIEVDAIPAAARLPVEYPAEM